MKDIRKLRETLMKKLNYELGIMEVSYLNYQFNELYNKKHFNDGCELSFEEKIALKFYTFGRYVKRYYLDKNNSK